LNEISVFSSFTPQLHKSRENTAQNSRQFQGFPAMFFCVKGLPELSHGKAFQLRSHLMQGTIQKNPYDGRVYAFPVCNCIFGNRKRLVRLDFAAPHRTSRYMLAS